MEAVASCVGRADILATLLALGPREFKEVGFTEPDGLFRLIGPKAKEMNRKGGAPYSVIS